MEIHKETIFSISKELGLQFTGVEQDWDIELANYARVNDFIKAYRDLSLNQKEKRFAIMSLIIASYNDYLEIKKDENNTLWLEIKNELSIDKDFFSELLLYWGLPNEANEYNMFKITKLIRNV